MAGIEHTFYGTWEIVSCTFEGQRETSGLEGIKFRLDDTSDITWYNDLVNPHAESGECSSCGDWAAVLFSCETFEVNAINPRLIFGAFAGHSIEFHTSTLNPSDRLELNCDNWYTLECQRLKEEHAIDQYREFTFTEALQEAYFSDVLIKSSDGFQYEVHACILRLNGFDCSMYIRNPPATSEIPKTTAISHQPVTISVTLPQIGFTKAEEKTVEQQHLPRLNLSPVYLQLPNAEFTLLDVKRRNQPISSSCNSLTVNGSVNPVEPKLSAVGHMPVLTSHSDSHLEAQPHQKNIFNFCPDIMLQQEQQHQHHHQQYSYNQQQQLSADHGSCSNIIRRPPLSPYRARSPSPFLTSMDTPPSSPLTPVGVLYDLPAFLLTPIMHWLYTESLMPGLDEDVCRQLISFAESQPTLTRMTECFRKYLKFTKLRTFVVDIIMDLHDMLYRTIDSINPITISFEPSILYATFANGLRDCCVGSAKILQLCNIFVKDVIDIARYQKNEIIKYVRAQIPLFVTQLRQLLDNTLGVFLHLTSTQRFELAKFLIPEVETALITIPCLLEEIKNSLEKVCKEMKCSHLETSTKTAAPIVGERLELCSPSNKDERFFKPMMPSINDDFLYQRTSLLNQRASRTFYDNSRDPRRTAGADNDLKFVLYMYEVRKMRNIFGRISTIFEVVCQKRDAFMEMDELSKQSTIYENIHQLIGYIPTCINLMEEVLDRVEGKLGWKEFKFCFKLATSQINGVLVKVFDHKKALKDALIQICKLVKKPEFTQALIDLELLEIDNVNTKILLHIEEKVASTITQERKITANTDTSKLNLVRHLCEPPVTFNSTLSKNALRLLHSGQLADMEFEVQTTSSSLSNFSGDGHPHIFRAHRVIVSARCECFKKALLSGMQESITRKIIIYDTTPLVFRRLLLYLYGAPIDKTVGAEQICELMMLADRYSVIDLKELCENTLNSLVDENSVLCLLGIADHYSATALKYKCMTYVSQHPNITKNIAFKELSQTLQLEVMDLIHWYGRVAEPWTDGGHSRKSRITSRHSFKSTGYKTRPRFRKSSPC